MDVPGGGSVLVPEPYCLPPRYPTYGDRIAGDVLVRYRNWRSTMSGHPDCDGMIAIGRVEKCGGIRDFMTMSRAGLSIHWGAADTVEGTAFTSNEQRYPIEEREGEQGPELVQLLSLHRVGWLKPYYMPALMYVAGHRNGLHLGVWITDKHGGARKAQSLVRNIAASFQR